MSAESSTAGEGYSDKQCGSIWVIGREAEARNAQV